MRIGGGAQWVTAPVGRAFHGAIPVNEVVWDDRQPWRSKLLKTLTAGYGRCPYFSETMAVLEPIVGFGPNGLAEFNIAAVTALCAHISLDLKGRLMSSQMGFATQSNELLIDIIRSVKGDVYLCGGGSGDYQNDESFRQAGIEVQYQSFQHPVYAQGSSTFEPGLSIVDALMNIGAAGTRAVLSVQ